MEALSRQNMTVDAELRAPVATAQLVSFNLSDPADGTLREEDAYLFNLCLSPRPENARACYKDHWGPHRFERLGSVFMVPPRETMQARSDGGRQTSIIYRLQPKAAHERLDRLRWTGPRLEASLDIHDANIRHLLLRLAQEMQNPGFASQALAELVASQMAIGLERFCQSITASTSRGGLAPWRLRLIDERLNEVHQPPTLAGLAALCKLSVRQLTRSFRESRGCSIGDYLANSQLDHAMRMLVAEQSVKSIAYSLGFGSPSSFCFAFRRATGQSPRQFQQRVLRRPSPRSMA